MFYVYEEFKLSRKFKTLEKAQAYLNKKYNNSIVLEPNNTYTYQDKTVIEITDYLKKANGWIAIGERFNYFIDNGPTKRIFLKKTSTDEHNRLICLKTQDIDSLRVILDKAAELGI